MFRLLGVAALLGISALAYVTLTAAAPVGIPYTESRVVSAGADIYAAHCAACHGAELKGEPHWEYPDAEGYMPAPPQDGTGHTHDHNDFILFNTVKYGPETTVCVGRKSRMGAFEGILEDDEILAVLAYIKSTWPDDIIERHNAISGRPTFDG